MTGKSLLTAAAGLALACGALVATAPASSAADCEYPANIVTTTTLKVTPSSIHAGGHATAHVKVRATGMGQKPTGLAVVTIDGFSLSGELHGGGAQIKLPTTLEPGTYEVTAQYVPAACSGFQESTSNTETLEVTGHPGNANSSDKSHGNGKHSESSVSGASFAGSDAAAARSLKQLSRWIVTVAYLGNWDSRSNGTGSLRVGSL